ncbi:hypothetical protein HKX48_001255 [Thoreauomyces humboldtii]|nr:hypothetical protein HKX48_001255 [Thoreauomyces humboldtii]
MAPIRSFALLFLASTATAANIHARQAVTSAADSTIATTAAVVSVATSAAAGVVAPVTIASVAVVAATPTTTAATAIVVVPATTAAASSTPVAAVVSAATSQAVAVASVTPAVATTAAVASATKTSSSPSTSATVASSASQIVNGSFVDLTAGTSSSISTGAVVGLSLAAMAVLALLGLVCFFRKRNTNNVNRTKGYKHRSSDAHTTLGNVHTNVNVSNGPTDSQLECGSVSNAMIEHPTFGGGAPRSARPSFSSSRAGSEANLMIRAQSMESVAASVASPERAFRPLSIQIPSTSVHYFAIDRPLPTVPQQQEAAASYASKGYEYGQ